MAPFIVEPINVVEVKSKASGLITRMNVETGSMVRPGELLAQIDTRDVMNQYNQALADVCATHATCKYDGGAVFGYPFKLSHLSTWDYFHPNTSGQAVLADVTWRAGFWPSS